MAAASQGAVEISAICDLSAARLRNAAALLPKARKFTDHRTMVAAGGIDLLVVATPPSAHVNAIRSGLEAGLHVVCEKPLALSSSDVANLRQVLHAHPGQGLVTVHQYEHAPGWKSLARVISGARACAEEWHLEIEVERPGTDPLSAGGWRAQPELEGGILGDHAVHYLAMVWKAAPDVRITAAERHGRGGRETARIELESGAHGHIELNVSYAGDARHNRIRLTRPEQGLTMAWDDAQLVISHAGDRARRHAVTALSTRDVVNSLYSPFYAEVVNNIRNATWRQRRNAESLAVAGLLAKVLEDVRAGELAASASFMGDLRGLARTILLAFADLGVYLGSDPERLMLKARSLDADNADQLAEFLDLCITAQLVTPSEAGRLRLAPAEAQRLARSLDGQTPVPDDQAAAWAQQLRGIAPA